MVLFKPELLAVYTLEKIAFKDKEKSFLIDIQWGNKIGHHKKLVTKAVRELQQSSAKSIYLLEWSKINGLLLFHSKIYIPDIYDLH